MQPYEQLPALTDLVLEESYVLDIEARPSTVRFAVDFVLTPRHPSYQPPPPNESNCYRKGELLFTGVRELAWSDQGAPPAHDASGEVDYGNIDALHWQGSRYELEGDWGQMEVLAESLTVRLG
jgi:hypothetical protein